MGVSQTLDYRNNKALPTKGFIATTALDFAPNGIGAVSFVRANARFSYYIQVTTKSSLALGARAGIISPLSDEQLPIDERFFNGGATTVRSFSELTLGPKDRASLPNRGESLQSSMSRMSFIWGDYTEPLRGCRMFRKAIRAAGCAAVAAAFATTFRSRRPIRLRSQPIVAAGEAQGAFTLPFVPHFNNISLNKPIGAINNVSIYVLYSISATIGDIERLP